MIAFALLLAQVDQPPTPVNPIVTTITAIRANPRKFDGQVVRLSGWVNRCQPSSCAIEERPTTAPGGAGQRLSIAANGKFYDAIRPLIPTYVEFDARLNAECPTVSVCTDRAPVLTIVSLRAVVSPAPPEIEN